MKLLEHAQDSYIRKMVCIVAMQFSFMPGRGTTDAIFTVRQLQDNYNTANKLLYFASVEFEKAFGHVHVVDLKEPWVCNPGYVLESSESCVGQMSVQ